jgi:hypothetical protein
MVSSSVAGCGPGPPHPIHPKKVSPMISIEQIEVNICTAFIAHVRAQFPTETHLSTRYIFILEVREWQLKRKLLNLTPTLNTRSTLLTGHRNAEKFLFDIDRGNDKTAIAEVEDILQEIAIEFFAEIQQIEAHYPEERAEFAREKEEHRLMWNNYVTEELEAAALEQK